VEEPSELARQGKVRLLSAVSPFSARDSPPGNGGCFDWSRLIRVAAAFF
jgi:hypothetical protein